MSRDRTLEMLRSPDYALNVSNRSQGEVRPYGSAAVVISRWKGEGTYEGGPFRDERCSLTWIRNGTRWQLAAEHCTPIAAAEDRRASPPTW